MIYVCIQKIYIYIYVQFHLQLALFRFNVRVMQENRKFLKAHFPTDESAREAAIRFQKCCVSMLDTFDLFKGKASLYKQSTAWGGNQKKYMYNMHIGANFNSSKFLCEETSKSLVSFVHIYIYIIHKWVVMGA